MPAKSKAQQRFMGMVHAYQKGELKDAPKSVKKAAKSMTKKAAKDFAETKHKGLPEKVKEAHGFGLDMTLDQLEQELEQLQQEHEEMLLSGDVESLDEIEAEITEIEELIHQKKLMQKDINVAEDLKSLTFKEYLRIDEGVLSNVRDFARGASATMKDVTARGQQITAQKNLIAMIQKLAAMVQKAQGIAVDTNQKQQAQRPAEKPAPKVTPAGAPMQKQAANTPTGQEATKDALAQRRAAGLFAGFELPIGKHTELYEGPIDFLKGAGKEALSRAQAAAQAYAQRSTVGQIIGAGVRAHREGKAAKSQAAMQQIAQNIVQQVRTMQSGQAVYTSIMKRLNKHSEELAQQVHQLVLMAAKTGAKDEATR